MCAKGPDAEIFDDSRAPPPAQGWLLLTQTDNTAAALFALPPATVLMRFDRLDSGEKTGGNTTSRSRDRGDQLLGPQAIETRTEVHIAVAAIPSLCNQTCPGNRATPVKVELDSALGARVVRDGLSTAADIRSFLELLPHLGRAHSVAGTELRKGPGPMRNYWRVS